MSKIGPDELEKFNELSFKDIIELDASTWKKYIENEGLEAIKERLSIYGTYGTDKIDKLTQRLETLFKNDPNTLQSLKKSTPKNVDPFSSMTYSQILKMDRLAWERQIETTEGLDAVKERLSIYGMKERNQLLDKFIELFGSNNRIFKILENNLPKIEQAKAVDAARDKALQEHMIIQVQKGLSGLTNNVQWETIRSKRQKSAAEQPTVLFKSPVLSDEQAKSIYETLDNSGVKATLINYDENNSYITIQYADAKKYLADIPPIDVAPPSPKSTQAESHKKPGILISYRQKQDQSHSRTNIDQDNSSEIEISPKKPPRG